LIGDLSAILLVLPLLAIIFAPGWFVGHDDLSPVRLFEQDVMIRAGYFPVRWYPDVAGGLGSPHPEFYAPLFTYLAQIFLFIGLSLTSALKFALAAVLIGTSLVMYRLAREFLGPEGGLVAAAAVTYAPYHLLDLFVRLAFSELTVFLFLPLALLTYLRLASGETPGRTLAAAASLAGLCLAHTVSLLIFPALLVAYVILLAWRERFRARFLLSSLVATVLGIAAAAFFLFPLAAEKNAVETSTYVEGFFDFHGHFETLLRLVWSPWGLGFKEARITNPISLRLGILAWIGSIAAVALGPRIRRRLPGASSFVLFAAAISAAGIVMAIPISLPLWESIPILKFVQFPWRFLLLPSIGMAILCGAVVSSLSARGDEGERPRYSSWIAPSLCLLFIAGSLPILGFERRLPLEKIRYRKEIALDPRRDTSAAASGYPRFTRAFVRDQLLLWGDHIPPGAPLDPGVAILDEPRARFANGAGRIDVVEEDPARFRIEVSASKPSLVRLHLYGFPGWTLRLDGHPAPFGPAVPDLPVLTIAVPAGDHVAEVSFERTPIRRAGDLTTAAAMLGLAILGAAEIRARLASRR
jgi:hypothetical protein